MTSLQKNLIVTHVSYIVMLQYIKGQGYEFDENKPLGSSYHIGKDNLEGPLTEIHDLLAAGTPPLNFVISDQFSDEVIANDLNFIGLAAKIDANTMET